MTLNVLQLAAGKGSRFKDYTDIPKPFIMVDEKPMFLTSFNSLKLHDSDIRYHLLCQKTHVEQYDPVQYKPDMNLHMIAYYTDGAATSAYSVIEHSLFKNEPWLIIDCDFIMQWNPVLPENCSASMVEYKSWDSKSSYSVIINDNIVAVAEKQPISKYRNTGQYLFETGDLFCEAYEFYKKNSLLSNGEFYIAPLLNYIIQNDKIVKALEVEKYIPIGTPYDLERYNER